MSDYNPFPGTENRKAIADDFQKMWKFTKYVCATDGKHITNKDLSKSVSQFHG